MTGRPDICIQCGWTIAPRNLEEVWLADRVFKLHRGGCPRVLAAPNDKQQGGNANKHDDDKNDGVQVHAPTLRV